MQAHFLPLWPYLASVAITVALAVGVNAAIDPYQLRPDPSAGAAETRRPYAYRNAYVFKAVAIKRLKPKAIVLGNSRTDIGVDPQHPSLRRVGTVYNAALPAADMQTIEKYFRKALASQPELKLVVIGLDLVAFFPHKTYTEVPSDFERYLDDRSFTWDILDTAFSTHTLLTSMRTWGQGLSGQEPREYYLNDGRRVRHLPDDAKPIDTMKFHLLQAYIRPGGWYDGRHVDASQLRALQAIVDTCNSRGIELKLFISPSHAVQSVARAESRMSDEFDRWKRELVRIAPVWDFSGIHTVTQEPINPSMTGYQESSHYNPVIGRMVLDRMFSIHNEKFPADFGALLSPGMLEAHLVNQRRALQQWSTQNAETTALIKRWRDDAFRGVHTESDS